LALTVAALVLWAFVWLRLHPRIDRDLREVAEALRLLGEVRDEPSERGGEEPKEQAGC
jgi:hypothetical protein